MAGRAEEDCGRRERGLKIERPRTFSSTILMPVSYDQAQIAVEVAQDEQVKSSVGWGSEGKGLLLDIRLYLSAATDELEKSERREQAEARDRISLASFGPRLVHLSLSFGRV